MESNFGHLAKNWSRKCMKEKLARTLDQWVNQMGANCAPCQLAVYEGCFWALLTGGPTKRRIGAVQPHRGSISFPPLAIADSIWLSAALTLSLSLGLSPGALGPLAGHIWRPSSSFSLPKHRARDSSTFSPSSPFFRPPSIWPRQSLCTPIYQLQVKMHSPNKLAHWIHFFPLDHLL